MSLHNIEFVYNVDGDEFEGFIPNLEVDEDLDKDEQEESVIFEIKSLYPDATNIEITKLEAL